MFNKSRQASAVRDCVTVTGQPLHSNLELQRKHISSATAILLTLHIGAFHVFFSITFRVLWSWCVFYKQCEFISQ